MKRSKILLSLLPLAGMLVLSSCSLFNDDDIIVTNSFNPITSQPASTDPDGATKINGVVGKEVASVPNALCFKSIPYAKNEVIKNNYGVGGKYHSEYNVNDGKDYEANNSSNNYDLYLPKSINKNEDHTVMLFIHGGAWVAGFKTDVNPYCFEFAKKGYITATIKYTLLNQKMDNPSLSLFRDLDEIDACITSIKESLGSLGFDTTKTHLVIGGASSGAHLSMLYTYSRGKDAALPIEFVIDAVGPVEIKPRAWKYFGDNSEEIRDAGLSYAAISIQEANGNLYELPVAGEEYGWNEYQTMKIANGMCGIPYDLDTVRAAADEEQKYIADPTNEAAISMTKDGGGEDLLSITSYIDATTTTPLIAAYAGQDWTVGIAQYAQLDKALTTYGVTHEMVYFRDQDHTEISEEKNPTKYQEFISRLEAWLAAI